ncbi:unnamed protein product [Victoria cruziana]
MKTMMVLALFLLAAMTIDGCSLEDSTLDCESLYRTVGDCLPYVTGIADRPFPVCYDGVHQLRGILHTHEDMVKSCECLQAKASGLRHLKEYNLGSLPMACGLKEVSRLNVNFEVAALWMLEAQRLNGRGETSSSDVAP